MLVTDYGNKKVRKIQVSTAVPRTYTVSSIHQFPDEKPSGIAVLPDKTALIVAVVHVSSGAGFFKKISLTGGNVVTDLAGSDFATRDGDGTAAAMKSLGQLAIEPSGNT